MRWLERGPARRTCDAARVTSDGPIGRGSFFTTVNRGQEDAATIATYDGPEGSSSTSPGKAQDVTELDFGFGEDTPISQPASTWDMRLIAHACAPGAMSSRVVDPPGPCNAQW
jgi:hypothetical protein